MWVPPWAPEILAPKGWSRSVDLPARRQAATDSVPSPRRPRIAICHAGHRVFLRVVYLREDRREATGTGPPPVRRCTRTGPPMADRREAARVRNWICGSPSRAHLTADIPAARARLATADRVAFQATAVRAVCPVTAVRTVRPAVAM